MTASGKFDYEAYLKEKKEMTDSVKHLIFDGHHPSNSHRDGLMVVQVAWMDDYKRIRTMPRPMRHHNVRNFMFRRGFMDFDKDGPVDGVQGFILSDGSFSDRDGSMENCEKTGQCTRENLIGGNILTSEDLWDFNGNDMWMNGSRSSFKPYAPDKEIDKINGLELSSKDGMKRLRFLLSLLSNYRDRVEYFKKRQSLSPLNDFYIKYLSKIENALELNSLDRYIAKCPLPVSTDGERVRAQFKDCL